MLQPTKHVRTMNKFVARRCLVLATTFLFVLATRCHAQIITGPTCGPAGPISIAGSTSVQPLAQAWANAYQQLCANSKVFVTGGGSTVGAQQVCAVSSAGSAVEIGALSRPIQPTTEANVTYPYSFINSTSNDFTYKCAQGVSTRTVIQVEVAIEGATIATKLNGVAAKCIASLPGGGLTLDQLRWIYSRYVLARLVQTGLSPTTLPKSDGDDSTHLWSELGGTNCPATEIQISGSPPDSETFALLVLAVLKDNVHGETIARGRFVGYYSDPNDDHLNLVKYLNDNPDAIGFFPTTYLNANNITGNLFVASLKGPDGSLHAPTVTTLGNGSYPLSRRLYMEVRSDELSVLAKVRPFFAFGYSKIGNRLVSGTGVAPLAKADQILMLSRLGAPGGVDPGSIRCEIGFSAVFDGSAVLYPLARIWSSLYGAVCGTNFNLSANGEDTAAAGLCAPLLSTVDVAMFGRPLTSSEVFRPGNTLYEFRCTNSSGRITRQVPVALDAITVSFASGGVSAKCISSLPDGGLTVDQIRWIYSSYTKAQLVASGWNASAVPKSDGNDATHLWSELGGADCPSREIKISGPPRKSDTFAFLSRAVFTGVNETVASNRPYGYYNDPQGNGNPVVQYLVTNRDAIGLLRFTDYNSNLGTISVAAVRNNVGSYVIPTETSVNSGNYGPLSQVLFFDLRVFLWPFYATKGMIQFGFNNDFLVRTAGLIPLSQTSKADAYKRLIYPLECFSEQSTVDVLGKGFISIRELSIGDMVKNAQGKFDRVYCLGHYAPYINVEFVQIQLADSTHQPLEITPEHMLFVNGAAIPASAVAVGDQVRLVYGNATEARVQSVKRIVRRGAYGPLTMSGTIAVNNVACSAYVDLQNDSGVLMMGGYKTPLSMQFLAHMFQATHRLVCKLSLDICKAEVHDDEGLSTRLALPVAAARWFFRQNTVVMIGVFVPVFIFGIFIFALEAVLDSKVVLLVALATWIAAKHSSRRNKRKSA